MDFKKNQEICLKIDDLGNNGEGIGHLDGYALFVKGALPGETIRAKIMKCKKNYGFARLIEVLPTDDDRERAEIGRVEPRCPVARQCGGCTLQHLSYEKQLAYKEKKVYDCLTRIGGVDLTTVECLPILAMTGDSKPWNYRNKAQFPVQMRRKEDGSLHPVAGVYAARTHTVIPVTDCAIQHPAMSEVLERVLEWMEEQKVPAYDEQTHTGIVRHVYIRHAFRSEEIMLCLVVNSSKIPKELSDTLVRAVSGIDHMTSISFNINTEKTNVILGDRMVYVWGKEHIEDKIGDVSYRISPKSFFQVNSRQTENLYKTALEFAELSGSETVWDLYCGIGSISLFLAKQAKKVYGVEIVPEAIENAKENTKLNKITNAEFFCGAAETVVPDLLKQPGMEKPDVVVLDPPRKGCDSGLLDTIVFMAPERIVYVSCDPATLARDVKILGQRGYELKKVRACDMFPQGGHVECVTLLQRKDI